MKKTKNSFITHGIINTIIFIPTIFATSIWGLLIIGTFDLDNLDNPFWYAIAMCPLLIPPVSCIAGIIRSSMNLKKDKHAKWCLILSIAGIFIYVGMLLLCAWLGSIA